ncbi:MAG: tRNA 2-thiouridine(34) synthase MnmA [Propionibacteriaceae bacterium]|jgi:tRNA-specific 2-thiouridylase|nr:tRNA 2-thiouridine(34) synthase MnmA [Propionibacteriaceae bacterium]
MSRLVAALSGGVDSAVAAARMVDAGHDVTAVHLALARNPLLHRAGSRGCCSLEDAHDAKRVADMLGIPYYVWDFSERFQQEVVVDFIAEYAAGRTPNPCLRCNERIKFAAMLDRALTLGFDGLITGHYARVEHAADDMVTLHRSVDTAKDQSYVLGVMTAEQLRHSHFPLGGSAKPAVRAEAAARGLLVADKPDSYDICFISDGDTAGWLHGFLGSQPGHIVDASGQVLGEHDGTYRFTIGQRKGLALTRPASDGKPRYVVDIDAASRRVTVAGHNRLAVAVLHCGRPTWCGPEVFGPWEGTVQVRAHAAEVPATIVADAENMLIALHSPVLGVAPGQSAVCYDGTRVVGSAIIQRTEPVSAETVVTPPTAVK